MTAAVADIIATVAARGLRLRVDDAGELAVRGPLDDALLSALRANREAIITTLRERASEPQTAPCAHCGKFAFPIPGVVCFWCRRAVGTRPVAAVQLFATTREDQPIERRHPAAPTQADPDSSTLVAGEERPRSE